MCQLQLQSELGNLFKFVCVNWIYNVKEAMIINLTIGGHKRWMVVGLQTYTAHHCLPPLSFSVRSSKAHGCVPLPVLHCSFWTATTARLMQNRFLEPNKSPGFRYPLHKPVSPHRFQMPAVCCNLSMDLTLRRVVRFQSKCWDLKVVLKRRADENSFIFLFKLCFYDFHPFFLDSDPTPSVMFQSCHSSFLTPIDPSPCLA